jgi:uncharacterized NAD-dependent epimerase/dehydratase family protein
MKDAAIILTGGILNQGNAKTAHGLIRNTSRYNIQGVIDKTSAGKDAGKIVDGIERGIPVYYDVKDFLAGMEVKPRFAIIGVAFPGGRLPAEMIDELKLIIQAGISIVSGLHDFLSENIALKTLADENGVELMDIRKPREKSELKFWSGEIQEVQCPIIGVLGTDCALGKRTTAVMITQAMVTKGYNAQMIFTGQTGWLQGHKYGFILDSTYNDFISGELENAIVSCFRNESPDLIFLEGQSALCNPSGPCGSEYILSAQCRGVILQHSPSRIYFNGHTHTGIKISLQKEIDLIRLYGAELIAITLNTKGLNETDAQVYKKEYEQKFGIPVVLPLEEGMHRLANAVAGYADKFNEKVII